jgi:AcrR family transcriptional regulator
MDEHSCSVKVAMTRPYPLNQRARQQAQTRRRIVEAAVDLHGTVGPARTSLSMVAERAGVQRNTLYAHFPDERSLLMACSGLAIERDPLPDPAAWRDIGDSGERLRTGLAAVYGWFERTEQLTACVMRDVEQHPVVREISELRYGPVVGGWHEVLGQGLSGEQRALLHLALSFHGWRALVREEGLDAAAATELMARAIETAAPS